MNAEWDSLRLQLAKMARRRDLRINEWSTDLPTEWNPTQVINPETDMPFSDSSAWHYIADLLESGFPFCSVELRTPKGAIGYETVVCTRRDLPKLYIKLQLKSGRLIGRSFHNSYK